MGCGPWAPGLTAARVLLVLLAEACVALPLPDYHCGLCDRLEGVQEGWLSPYATTMPSTAGTTTAATLRMPTTWTRRWIRPDRWVLRLRVPKKRCLALNERMMHTNYVPLIPPTVIEDPRSPGGPHTAGGRCPVTQSRLVRPGPPPATGRGRTAAKKNVPAWSPLPTLTQQSAMPTPSPLAAPA